MYVHTYVLYINVNNRNLDAYYVTSIINLNLLPFVKKVYLMSAFDVAGVPAVVPGVTVDNSTIIINGNNVTLTLSWGEPFNNFDPTVSYTVSCSGDDKCPSNFTTTDNTYYKKLYYH